MKQDIVVTATVTIRDTELPPETWATAVRNALENRSDLCISRETDDTIEVESDVVESEGA